MTSKVQEINRDWYCAEGTILQVQLYQTPFWIYSSPSSNKHTWGSLSSPAGFKMSSGSPCLQNSSASALTITESQYRFGMPQKAKYKHTKNQTQRELLTTQKPLSLGSGGCRESRASPKRLYAYWETPNQDQRRTDIQWKQAGVYWIKVWAWNHYPALQHSVWRVAPSLWVYIHRDYILHR